jgi:hypothetical protein
MEPPSGYPASGTPLPTTPFVRRVLALCVARYAGGCRSVKRALTRCVTLQRRCHACLVSGLVSGKKSDCKPLKSLFVSLIWGPLGDVNDFKYFQYIQRLRQMSYGNATAYRDAATGFKPPAR